MTPLKQGGNVKMLCVLHKITGVIMCIVGLIGLFLEGFFIAAGIVDWIGICIFFALLIIGGFFVNERPH